MSVIGKKNFETIVMWGVYPEASDWNVDALCSDFHLGVCILKKAPDLPNLSLFLKVPNFNAWVVFLKIRSPTLKYKHIEPTFQSLPSG